jgi:hypothetical protein
LGDPSLVLFWLAKHVIIFLLIPGDPSLALRDDRTFGVKEGKEVAIRTAIAT